MTGCKHESTTVSLIFKDDIMTRRCDNCRALFGPYYLWDPRQPWRKAPKEKTK